MNTSLVSLEITVLLAGLFFLMLDLWVAPQHSVRFGYAAAVVLGLILLWSFKWDVSTPQYAFKNAYVLDHLALFFKRFFLIAGIFVLLMSVDYADRIRSGIAEFYSLVMFALAGMMFAASANDFAMLFVSIELITVTFYVLASALRDRVTSLEGGVKYLILGGISSAIMVYGIALVYGTSKVMTFPELAQVKVDPKLANLFLVGVLMVVAGLAFKIAVFPLHIWAPDVYQGSPTPATAFLAVGSKAAGFALLLRFLFGAVPHSVIEHWGKVLMVMSGLTILYGSLCAIPQRNLKRLLGYSSIANGGYLMLGIASMTQAGSTAVLYYLSGYLFTVLAAFIVISIVTRHLENEDISALSGLYQRSPFVASTLALSMISLAGIPPLAGFFGKFLLFKSVLELGGAYYILVAIAIFGVVASIYYYFGVIRAMYAATNPAFRTSSEPLLLTAPMRMALWVCVIGMLYLGIFPNTPLDLASRATSVLKF